MKIRTAIICIWGVATVALVWWVASEPSISVRDVRQAETLVLGTKDGRLVSRISIQGSGRIDGDATITLLSEGKPYWVKELTGPVDFVWGGDWYDETAEVRYEPGNVRSGELVLRYRIGKY